MQTKNETAGWTDVQAVEKRLLRPDISLDESQELYTKWAESGNYDELVGKSENSSAFDILHSAVNGLFLQPEKVLILDVGAGTGLGGERLRDLGYSSLHALEPNSAFVKIITQKGLYKKIIHQFIGGDKPVDIPDDTYDAVVSVGALGPGHIPCSGVPEIVRIVKPGGYVIICMRQEYMWTVPEYKGRLEKLMQQLETEGRWKKSKWEIYPNHFGDKNGILMVYQVC